MININHNATH